MRKICKKLLRYVYFLTAFLFLFTINVNAYIDPSVMTYAIQALAGIAIALGTFFGLYWRKIRKPVLRFFNLDETAGKEEESDELVYFDPSVMKEERKIIIQKDLKTKDGVKPKGKIRTILEDMIPALFITLSGCFMVCIYAPLDLYFTNKTEFWYNSATLSAQLFRMFGYAVPAVLLVYLVSRLISRKLYNGVLFITLTAFICSYIQGNFRIANLPAMDGRAIDWSVFGTENIITLIIWIIVTGLLVTVYRFVKAKGFKSVAEVVSCVLLVVCTISLISSYMGSRHIVKESEFVTSTDHELDVSDTENFYILVLDALDADTYRTVSESHPEYQEWFSDFTFFPNTTSLYPFTSHAIPHILSGIVYENERDFTEFATDALDQSPFLNTLEKQGYHMGIYEPDLIYGGDQLKRFDNIQTDNIHLNPEAKNTFVKEQMKMVLFKYLPYYFKKYIDCDTNIFTSMKGSNPFTPYNRDFYLDLQNGEVKHIHDKNFRFYHVEGAHVPFKYDADVNYIPYEQGSYEQNIEASMKVADTFLKKLKDAGVYEKSTIIIMADHGYQAGSESNLDRFNPLLMIKGFNETHEYTVNEAPISYLDLPEAYNRLLDHKTAAECFDAKEGDQRERRILYFVYLQEDLIQEYIQDGYASDYENLKPTGNEYRR